MKPIHAGILLSTLFHQNMHSMPRAGGKTEKPAKENIAPSHLSTIPTTPTTHPAPKALNAIPKVIPTQSPQRPELRPLSIHNSTHPTPATQEKMPSATHPLHTLPMAQNRSSNSLKALGKQIDNEFDNLHAKKKALFSTLKGLDATLDKARSAATEVKNKGFPLLNDVSMNDARTAYDNAKSVLAEVQKTEATIKANVPLVNERIGELRETINVIQNLITQYEQEKKQFTEGASEKTGIPQAHSTGMPLAATAQPEPLADTERPARQSHGIKHLISSWTAALISGARSAYQWVMRGNENESSAPIQLIAPQPISEQPSSPPPTSLADLSRETLTIITQINLTTETSDNTRIMLQEQVDGVVRLTQELRTSLMHSPELARQYERSLKKENYVEPSWKRVVVRIFSRILDGAIIACQRVYAVIKAGLNYIFGREVNSFVRDVESQVDTEAH